jgi:hypothetical protein
MGRRVNSSKTRTQTPELDFVPDHVRKSRISQGNNMEAESDPDSITDIGNNMADGDLDMTANQEAESEGTPLESNCPIPMGQSSDDIIGTRNTRARNPPVRFQDYELYNITNPARNIKIPTKTIPFTTVIGSKMERQDRDKDVLEIHAESESLTDASSDSNSSSSGSSSSGSSSSGDSSSESDSNSSIGSPMKGGSYNLPSSPAPGIDDTRPSISSETVLQVKTELVAAKHDVDSDCVMVSSANLSNPRTKISRKERSSSKVQGKVYPCTGTLSDLPYVMQKTKVKFDKDYATAKETKCCPTCKVTFTSKSADLIRRHVWDHYVCYVCCHCGFYTTKYETLHSHKRRNHPGATSQKIDKYMFKKAKSELSAQLPAVFPHRATEHQPPLDKILSDMTNMQVKNPVSPIKSPDQALIVKSQRSKSPVKSQRSKSPVKSPSYAEKVKSQGPVSPCPQKVKSQRSISPPKVRTPKKVTVQPRSKPATYVPAMPTVTIQNHQAAPQIMMTKIPKRTVSIATSPIKTGEPRPKKPRYDDTHRRVVRYTSRIRELQQQNKDLSRQQTINNNEILELNSKIEKEISILGEDCVRSHK